jgi:hypothetical protein
MVKNRKPLFVSEQAHQRLAELSAEKKMFKGDLVDILLGIKTDEDIEHDYKEDTRISSRIRRVAGAEVPVVE